MSQKPLKTLIRREKWELDEKQRELKQLRDAEDSVRFRQKTLEEEKKKEDDLVRKEPELGMTYASYLKVYLETREKLKEALKKVLDSIQKKMDELQEVFTRLKTYEITLKNQQAREQAERDLKLQVELDEIAQNTHRRKNADGTDQD